MRHAGQVYFRALEQPPHLQSSPIHSTVAKQFPSAPSPRDHKKATHLMTPAPETTVASLSGARRARFAVAAIFCLNGVALANWISRIPDVKQQLRLNEQLL